MLIIYEKYNKKNEFKVLLEFSEDPVTLFLLLVTVDTHSRPAVPPHQAGQLIRLTFCLHKDEDLGAGVGADLLEQAGQLRLLLVLAADVNNLGGTI